MVGLCSPWSHFMGVGLVSPSPPESTTIRPCFRLLKVCACKLFLPEYFVLHLCWFMVLWTMKVRMVVTSWG